MKPESALTELITIFGDNLIIAERDRASRAKELESYGHDQAGGGGRYRQEPAAVVFPTTSEQVVSLMKWANRTQTPVTPRGAGSGLAAGAVPVPGGVVCAFEKMNRILEIDTDNLMAVVEPGVVTNTLDRALEPHGLFFAGYPMSEDICYIGGNAAENAGGGRAVKYGTTAAWITGAEVVIPTGEILRLGGKRLKDVTGYNLLQLMIGSEGTLGLFTQLTIRVIPRPAVRGLFLAAFPSVAAAAACVAELKRRSNPSAVEFMDGETAVQANRSVPATRRLAIPEDTGAFLLVEYDGDTPETVMAAVSRGGTIAADHQGRVTVSGTDPQTMDSAWKMRKQVPWWVKRTAGPYHSVEDVVVPPSRIPDLVAWVEEQRRTGPLRIALFGHAGDGNFHINPMKPPDMSPEEWDTASKELLTSLYHEVVRLGGTISGEHGIGRKRAASLSIALSPQELATMRAIKSGLDPHNILNPGVILL